MKDNRVILVVGAVVTIAAMLGCCVLAASGVLLSSGVKGLLSGPAKPDHHGVYLKQGRQLVEIEKCYRPPLFSEHKPGVPYTTSQRPTLILWDPDIDVNRISLRDPIMLESIGLTVKESGEVLELTPQTPLSGGLYCLKEGGRSDISAHWCFRVG
jgi:hypothetical protein